MWDEIRETHKPKMLWAFFILIVVFAVFIGLGAYFGALSYIKSHNSIVDSNSTSMLTNSTDTNVANITVPTQQTKIGQTEFTLPRLRFASGPTSYSAYVTCNVSSIFVQNSPSNITVEQSFPAITQADLNVSTIFVQPVNALLARKDWTSPTGYSSLGPPNNFLILWRTEDRGATQVWTSSIGFSGYWNTFLFQDVGLINLKITIYAEPTDFALNYTDWLAYNSTYVPFVTTVAIPNTFMDSIETVQLQQAQQVWQQSMLTQTKLLQAIENQSLTMQQRWQAQQEISSDMNLSLTFLVLAFMSLDMAVIVFDHSVDEKRKAEYEKKRAEKTEDNILEPPEYAV